MKKVHYPEVEAEMAKRGLNLKDIAKILKISPPTVYRRLSGKVDWGISDIEALCHEFNKDYYELFKKGV